MPEKSTSSDLAALAQGSVDAWTAGDIDGVLSFPAPDVVLEMPETFGAYRGPAAIRDFVTDWIGAYDSFRVEAGEICDLGNGVIFVLTILQGRLRGATAWIQFRYGALVKSRDRLIERITKYLDLDEARASAERLAQRR